MPFLATTPAPPYTAVIFTSVRAPGGPADDDAYAATAARMEHLARERSGFLGIESARSGDEGITVSYWRDADAARAWKQVTEHLVAQGRGRREWYTTYRVRVATVERDYGP